MTWWDTVAIVSGGMDSATLVYHLLDKRREVKCLSFDYGQRHKRELLAAEQLCLGKGLSWEKVDLTSLTSLLAGSALTSPEIEVPEGHYEEESMKATVVPNRNMIMLSIAIGHAISIGADTVAYGAHSGDHAIYPDCRESFATAMDLSAQLCDWKEIRLLRPFIGIDKSGIASIGDKLGVPWSLTWTCYKGGDHHCGKCGSCQERIEAFAKAGVVDPMTKERLRIA